MADHDHSYKLLFSHASLVRDLLQGFVLESWVADLDLSTLEKTASTFVGDALSERERFTLIANGLSFVIYSLAFSPIYNFSGFIRVIYFKVI